MSQGITYETAKQLKDAGFPYKRRSTEFILYEKDGKLGVVNRWLRDGEQNEKAAIEIIIPTLSELIEACGYAFYLTANAKGYWYAANAHHSQAIKCSGSNPEEAVSALYLALHPLTHL